MVNFFKSDKGIVLILVLLFCFVLPFFYLNQGTFLIDTGRELYISQQVANGEVLYKDILDIYGPFAYQFTAILFNIFGETINTVYNAGVINSLIIVVTLFLLAREFLNKGLSLSIAILSIFSLVFTTHLFNSNLPYSFGLSYALSSLLLSMLFLVKYLKSPSLKYACLSSFFAGLSVVNKYEFFLYPIVLLFAFSKPLNIKEKLLTFLSFLTMPIVCFAPLFLSGLTLLDFKNAVSTMITLGTSDNIKLFYSNYGNIYEQSAYQTLLKQSPLITTLGFLPIANIVIFLSKIKDIVKNKPKLIFCVATILASAKFTLFMNVRHMGAFIFPLCLMMFLILIQNSNVKEQFKYIFIAFLIFVFIGYDVNSVNKRNYLLKTPKGNIKTTLQVGLPLYSASDYILKNTKDTDKIFVTPEGTFINFITDRKSENLHHNLVPLYYNDTFGEDEVMSAFSVNPMDYILIFPTDMTEYGSKYFCDYAVRFCEMIDNDYILVKEVDEVKIYKRKNK